MGKKKIGKSLKNILYSPETNITSDHKNLFIITIKLLQRCINLYIKPYNMHACIKKCLEIILSILKEFKLN